MRKFVTPVRATAGASNSSAIETSRPGELPRLRARRLSFEKPQYRFILHDRDAIFSPGFDESLSHLDLEIVTTPVRSPQANALCERLIGTLRWECLDWIIPLTEDHLRRTLWSWLPHYNRGRPHTSLGPGFPVPRQHCPAQVQRQRYRFDRPSRVVAHPVLNGLHHEYSLSARAA